MNIFETREWFEVLQTTERSQSAVMTLAPGQASGSTPESHAASDQTLLLVRGRLTAEIDGQLSTMKAGDVVIIPAGIKHRFSNPGEDEALTFNVYAPPEYPPGQKG